MKTKLVTDISNAIDEHLEEHDDVGTLDIVEALITVAHYTITERGRTLNERMRPIRRRNGKQVRHR